MFLRFALLCLAVESVIAVRLGSTTTTDHHQRELQQSTNLALNAKAIASTECFSGPAMQAIDGDNQTISHTCCDEVPWLKVDMGLGSSNVIENVVIKNRADCCGGRTR